LLIGGGDEVVEKSFVLIDRGLDTGIKISIGNDSAGISFGTVDNGAKKFKNGADKSQGIGPILRTGLGGSLAQIGTGNCLMIRESLTDNLAIGGRNVAPGNLTFAFFAIDRITGAISIADLDNRGQRASVNSINTVEQF